MKPPPYIGRFAPSPTGPLHFGSLVCAIASYLDARAHNGKWLLRIDDIDTTREVVGASNQILKSLQAHGMAWDDEVSFQNKNTQHYDDALEHLANLQLTYRCDCNRKRLSNLAGQYDGCCRDKNLSDQAPTSVRLNIDKSLALLGKRSSKITFDDTIQGLFHEDLARGGDYIVHRKDGLFAYQLAVVVEDIRQGISHILRGVDLLETTAKHILLNELLEGSKAIFLHIPVITDEQGRKLSKQNHAPAINDDSCQKNLYEALCYLRQNPPIELESQSVKNIIDWGVEHWSTKRLYKCKNLVMR